jgi:hypothetical protein
MNLKTPVAALLLGALLAACSTIDRNIAITAQTAGAGFALVVADGMVVNGSESYTYAFQRVDLASSTFAKETFTVTFSGLGASVEGNEFRKPEGLETTLRFGGKTAPVGDYALVMRTDNAAYGYASSTFVNCYAAGAPVFHIREGAVNVLPAQGPRSRGLDLDVVRPQVEQVLAGYPNMTAPRAYEAPVGVLTFKTGRAWTGAETCRPDGAFAFAPFGAPAS